VSTGVAGKQGGVEMSAHCRAGLHAGLGYKAHRFRRQLTPSNLRGDRRAS